MFILANHKVKDIEDAKEILCNLLENNPELEKELDEIIEKEDGGNFETGHEIIKFRYKTISNLISKFFKNKKLNSAIAQNLVVSAKDEIMYKKLCDWVIEYDSK
ncbi:MAG: hypothetical protein RSB33_06010 [Cetobacterium sp.]